MRLIRFFTALAIILVFLCIKQTYAAPMSTRIGGVDRYETAIKICQSGFHNSDYVILVQGEDFPDALCAAPIGKKYNAPILLVKPSGIDNNLLNEILRLNAKNAIIIGGIGVVPKTVESVLNSFNINVTRYAGVDRFQTSAMVAKEIGVSNGAIIVSGDNFPDALSIASIAAAKQMPILLVQASFIPSSIENFIDDNKIENFYVIGGQGVIYDATIAKLNKVKRLSGANRYETNIAVVSEFKKDLNLDSIYVASGETFPDALGGAAMASISNSPILLTNSYHNEILGYIRRNISSINNIKILGGSGAIPDWMIPRLTDPGNFLGKVLGYATYYYYGAKESYFDIFNNSSTLDEIATDTFSTDGAGNLIAEKGYNSLGELTDLIPTDQIALAKSQNIDSYVMVTNGFNADTARELLRNSTSRQNLINSIISTIRLYNYNGVNIDIEGIYYDDRVYFSEFMKELYTSMKVYGYMVTIAVPAKTTDYLQDGWSGGYDYSEIAKYSDQVSIMTYDEHWSGGSPGPIASINWVEAVIKYSITTIPKEKILLGLASYGYDWGTNLKSKAYSIDQAIAVAKANSSNIIFDNDSKSPHYDYTQNGIKHYVWFENAESIGYKLDLVNNYHIGGISIWSLGQTNPEYWTTIRTKLNK